MAYQQDPDHELLAPTARRPTNQTDKVQTPEWTPTIHETLLMLMLSSVSFMVALDSCVIITALNVGTSSINLQMGFSQLIGYNNGPRDHHGAGVLDRYILLVK